MCVLNVCSKKEQRKIAVSIAASRNWACKQYTALPGVRGRRWDIITTEMMARADGARPQFTYVRSKQNLLKDDALTRSN